MLFCELKNSLLVINFPHRTLSSITAPSPSGRPYCRLERAARRSSEVLRVRRDEDMRGSWPASAAWKRADCQAEMLAV
jgi:hypothetical protein